MIIARHNTFAFWLYVCSIFLFTFLIISTLSQWCFNFTIFKISLHSSNEFYTQLFFLGLGLLLCICILLAKVKRISINPVEKLIVIKTLLFPITEKYTFDEIDGYAETTQLHESWRRYKTLCLIKGKNIIVKIDSFYYSNLEEIQKGIQDVKYLGIVKSDIFNSTKPNS